MSRRYPAQKPVPIPEHLRHGSSYVYRYYKCRCGRCQDWRRGYDRERDQASRRGIWEPRRGDGGRNPWYVCAENGRRYRKHDYRAGVCLRCDAVQAVEEFWERKWEESA